MNPLVLMTCDKSLAAKPSTRPVTHSREPVGAMAAAGGEQYTQLIANIHPCS